MGMAATELLPLRQYVRIVHHIPGRLRVRLTNGGIAAARKFDLTRFRHLLEKVPAVRDLQVSAASLSVVIHYDKSAIAPALWEDLIEGTAPDAQSAIRTLESAIKEGGV